MNAACNAPQLLTAFAYLCKVHVIFLPLICREARSFWLDPKGTKKSRQKKSFSPLCRFLTLFGFVRKAKPAFTPCSRPAFSVGPLRF